MSRKYLILADIDGQIRILSMRSNGSQKGIEKLCRQMAGKLFANHKVGDLWVEPWPVDDPTGQPHSDTVALTQGPAHNTNHQLVHLNKRKPNKREVNLVKSPKISLVV